VVADGQLIKYLGCPFGRKITQHQEAQFILNKMRSKLRHWTNRMLTMASKLVLLKYVLRAMPTFYLMLLDFTEEKFRELEAVCRQFLWGTQAGGQAKVPLVAWSKICQPKAEGGLGMVDFRQQVQVFKLRFISGILGMHNADWVHLVSAEIEAGLNRGRLRKDLKFWTVSEFLLCRPPVEFKSRMVRCLLKSWDAVWPRLQLTPEGSEITWNLSILHVYCLFRKGQEFSIPEYRRLRVWAHTRGVHLVDDMIRDKDWLLESVIESRVRSSRNLERPIFLQFHQFVTSFTGATYLPITWMSGWEWSGFQRVTTGWTLPLQKWRALSAGEAVNQSHLNRRWGCAFSEQDWKQFWNQLWNGKTHSRTKFVIWRLMKTGFFTNTRGALWGVSTETCPVCGVAPETTAHLFFECSEVKRRWVKAIKIIRRSQMAFGRVDNAFEVIAVAVKKHLYNPALLVLVAEIVWTTWVERNVRVFQGNTARMPLQVIFCNCATKLEALEGATGNLKKLAILRENKQYLLRYVEYMTSVSTDL
jgi:hypothetical protein